MQSLEQNEQRLSELNTVALGLSVDSSPSKKAWAASLNIEKTRLLADFWPHGEVAKVFGLFNDEKGISERANIIIDENQQVVLVKVYPMSELPDIAEILKALEDL
jgi:peroxiredoxin